MLSEIHALDGSAINIIWWSGCLLFSDGPILQQVTVEGINRLLGPIKGVRVSSVKVKFFAMLNVDFKMGVSDVELRYM